LCLQKTNLCKKCLSWNQKQNSPPSIVVDRNWRGLESLLLVMKTKREWHNDFMIKCCTIDKRSGICWLLFFLTQKNNSFPFHVLTFNSHIIFLLLSLLFITLYLLILCSTTYWLHFFLTKTRLLSLSCSHLWLPHFFSIPNLFLILLFLFFYIETQQHTSLDKPLTPPSQTHWQRADKSFTYIPLDLKFEPKTFLRS
jgi:hypothetical protein